MEGPFLRGGPRPIRAFCVSDPKISSTEVDSLRHRSTLAPCRLGVPNRNAGWCCSRVLPDRISEKRRSGDCARKAAELTPGGLLRVAAATEAVERQPDPGAEVSRGILGLILISDNAQYHRSSLHLDWRQQHQSQFALQFLPPYSPELNPIERLWKLTRRLCLH